MKKEELRASLIVPMYNAEDTIEDLIESLKNQSVTNGWEVIFVDNGSKDQTTQKVAAHLPSISLSKLIVADQKPGPSYARNQGVKESKADILLFCDSDDTVSDNWIESMIEGVERHEFIGCRMDQTLLNPPELVGMIPFLPDNSLMDYGYYPYTTGGTIGINRSLFEAFQGFDERLHFGEDVDLCFRIQLTGKSLHYWPDTYINYRLRSRLKDILKQCYNWSRYSKINAFRYRNHGHKPVKFHYKNIIIMLKCMIIFILRIYDRKKRILYGRYFMQTLAFSLPVPKSMDHSPILADSVHQEQLINPTYTHNPSCDG